MPRTTDLAHVRHWAELSVQGKTIAEIRKAHKERTKKMVDPRTIQRALERTQAEIAERTATAAELQRGIRVHGERLLASTEPLMKTVSSTTSGRLNPHPIYAIDAKHLTIGSSMAEQRGGSWRVQIRGDDAIEFRLLKEHLPNDKTWQKLERFSNSIADWITARIEFAFEIKRELKKVPKVLGISSTTTAEPFEQTGLTKIDAAAATARTEGVLNVDELLDSLAVDMEHGGVRLDSTTLSSLHVVDIASFRVAVRTASPLL